MMLMDAVVLHLAFALAGVLYEGNWGLPRNMLAAQKLLPLFFTIALYNETYGGQALANWTFAAKRGLTALVIAAAFLNFVACYTKSKAEFSRVSVTLGLLAFGVAIVATRWLLGMVIDRYWQRRTTNQLTIDDGGPTVPSKDGDVIAAADYQLGPSSHDPFMLGKLLQNQDKMVVSTPR